MTFGVNRSYNTTDGIAAWATSCNNPNITFNNINSDGGDLSLYTGTDKTASIGSTSYAIKTAPTMVMKMGATNGIYDGYVGYSFTIASGYKVTLSSFEGLIANGGGTQNFKIDLCEADGTLIKTIGEKTGATASWETSQELTNVLAAGTYQLRVYAAKTAGGNKYDTPVKLLFNGSIEEDRNKMAITIINAELNGGTNAPTVTGVYAGSAEAKTQSTVDDGGGYKLGSQDYYVGITLADGKTFKKGDILHVNVTTGCGGTAKLALYSDKGQTLICATEIGQGTGDLTFTLTDAFNSLSTFYLYRSKEYGWNGFVKSVYVVRTVEVETVNVGSAGYATYVTPCALDFTDTDVTAYAVSADVEKNVVHMTSYDKVPAGKAIVVKGAQGTHSIPVAASAEDFATDLEVSAETITYDEGAAYDYYYLGKEGENVGFRRLGSGSLAAGKCFFKIEKTPTTPAVLRMSFGEATAIKTIESSANNAVRYNLAGQRVNANMKGIVIVNGKKMLNK